MRARSVIPLVVATLVLGLTSCGKLTVEEKYQHLRDVAGKGADAHFVLINENKPTTREACDQHYNVFVPDGVPSESKEVLERSPEWIQLSKDYFGDSCVKGEPRVIQTRSTAPSSTSEPASSAPASSPAGP